MTDIIDINIKQSGYSNRLASKFYGQVKGAICRKAYLYHSLKEKERNHFSFILKQNKTQYDLLFEVAFQQPQTLVQIFILSECGKIMSIDSQSSKTYLFKKLFKSQNVCQARVDPISGSIYFNLSYFSQKRSKGFGQFSQLDSIFQNLNFQKLYVSIKNILACDNINGEHNYQGQKPGQKMCFKQLSKAVSLLNDKSAFDLFQGMKTNLEKRQISVQSGKNKNKISQFRYFFGGTKRSPNQSKLKKLKNIVRELDEQNKNLATLMKRKNSKSNYQPLLINLSSRKVLKQSMVHMLQTNTERISLKVVESQLGKVTINLLKQQEKVYLLQTKLLSLLHKNTQYYFLDKYFRNDLNIPILMSLSLKEESLPIYLENNKLTISIQTKMRILLQICSAVHSFWEQNKIILQVNKLSKMYITKNLTIKIRSLSQYFKVEPHMMLQDRMMVNKRLMDNCLNLTQIYSRLFFNHTLVYIRPSAQRHLQLSISGLYRTPLIFERLMGTRLLPEGFGRHMKQVIVAINYLFLSYIEQAKRLVQEQQQKHTQKETFFCQHSQNQSERCNEAENHNKDDTKLINYKYTCCKLLKVFRNITQETI